MTDDEIIRKFAGLVLRSYADHQYQDIDGCDLHEFTVSSGLAVPGHVTEADVDDGWPAEWDLDLGDPCERFTPLAMKLVKMGKDGRANELHKEQG